MRRRIQAWLEREWYSGQGHVVWLLPLAGLFALGSALRRRWFRSRPASVYRSHLPVVVVGNLSVGGTGKSPVVAALVDALQRRGVRPGILARGYGATLRHPRWVTPHSSAAEVGDEPLMLALDCAVPVVVTPDRCAGAKLLETAAIDVIICDDGLQHYALARDLEIVVVDGRRGFGNGRLLPAGPLRESMSRLAGVDFVVVNGDASEALAAELACRSQRATTLTVQLHTAVPRQVVDCRKWRSLESFRGATVHAVAGIGHPQRFFGGLRAAGLQLIEHPFDDHHPYSARDLEFDDDLPILMTRKDAVKCRHFAPAHCWQVPVTPRLQPDDGRQLIDPICALVAARKH